MHNKKSDGFTNPQDWNSYYGKEHLERSNIPTYMIFILNKEVWCYKPGKLFELGCGSSLYLAKSALSGWEVSGIDFNKKAIESLKNYLQNKGVKFGHLIFKDVFDYDCTLLANKYDFLVSFGFLEHFRNPENILRRWCVILKPGGRVISVIPNLMSLNAKLLKRYNFQLWRKHIIITPLQFDRMHLDAGLRIIRPAIYTGGYDLDMLIPWNKIREKYPLFILKLLRYFGTFIAYYFKIFFKDNHRLINPIIYGVYEKK